MDETNNKDNSSIIKTEAGINMTFLTKETEKLLQECLERSNDFPQILAEKFKGLSGEEDNRLRDRIKDLINNGYISNLKWADNVPWIGRITEAGYDYFYKKEVFIRAKLRSNPSIKLLDSECENALKSLCAINDYFIDIDGTIKEGSIYEQLEKDGYIKLGGGGLSYDSSGSFVGVASVTQTGKNYFSQKEMLIEEILTLSENEPNNTIISPKSSNQSTAQQTVTNPEVEGKLTFYGVLGFDCGEIEDYKGADKQLKEKGFVVRNGIPTLRGFAKMSDLAAASKAKYDDYQRKEDLNHVKEIESFLTEGKAEARFLPEVVLSINQPDKAILCKYSKSISNSMSATLKGTIDNMDYYSLQVDTESLARVDGNHRLEAGKQKDIYVPFSIIVWNVDLENEENVISTTGNINNTESEAFLFYILNNTAKRLEAEENYKGLVNSKSWTESELAMINRHLPLLKYYNEKYADNPLIDKEYLYEPFSQICDILTEINSEDIDKEEFDIILYDAIKLINQCEKYNYCRNCFKKIFFQLAFYTRYKSENYNEAQRNLKLVNEWLEKYKYSFDTFTKASKLYDIAYKFISASPKTIFMAMEYKSEQIVADYNGSLSRAVYTINNMGGSIEVNNYPIMTGEGKSVSITADIYQKIENCSIFIADTTEANPNVMYELGIAYNTKKPIIMVREKGKRIKVPSDIISEYYYSFSGMTELEALLVKHIKKVLIDDYGAVFPI